MFSAKQFLLLAAFGFLGCAPKPIERVYPEPKTDFGPRQSDVAIPAKRLRSTSVASAMISWSEAIDSARIFRFGEAALELGQLTNSPELQKLGVRLGTAFYSNSLNATHSSFQSSVFLKAAVGETRDDVMSLIGKYDALIVEQLPRLRSILKAASSSFRWPSADQDPVSAVRAAKNFANIFIQRLRSSDDIDADLAKGIAGAFRSDFYPFLDALEANLDSILSESDSIQMIDEIKALSAKYDVDFGSEATQMLNQARAIFVEIGDIDHKQDALTVIVELWELTPPEARESTFKPVSEGLYDFLKNKGPKSLACVKSSGCLNPIILLEKKLGVLPAIQKYGLEKLKTDIARAAHDAFVGQIKTAVVGFGPTLPNEIDDKITEQAAKLRAQLASVKADYPGFVKTVAQEFEKQTLKQDDGLRLAGVESRRAKLKLEPGDIQISAAASEMKSELSAGDEDAITTGSEVLGASMSYAARMWSVAPVGSLAYSKSVLTQINKMLALGGFETPSKEPYDSLAVQVDGGKLHFDVRKDLGSKVAFAVPDSFNIGPDLDLKIARGARDVSVRGQAELLRGLAAMARSFQDWKKTGYDETLGSVNVGALIKDLPAGTVDARLFPKESFFALSVANAANILVNMTKAFSPVFLIDIDRGVKWANDRVDGVDPPATMAGVVDIVHGERASIVQTGDAARFLLAIADFLDATNGIEETKAHPFITPGPDGKKPLDQLIEARSQLRLLVVGLGNFISHELQNADGGLRPSFDKSRVTTRADEPRRALDQALAILALLKAGEVLEKQIYDWTALDAYFFMNRSLYNAKTGFYNAFEGSDSLPRPDEIALILLAVEKLRPKMTQQSQIQWAMISKPWLKALENLN